MRPRQFTNEDILTATQACILELGPSVSTNVIAERVGMSQAALFKRFGTKEKLFLEALSRPMKNNPSMDLLEKGPTDEPIREQMTCVGEAILTVMRRVVPCMAMLHAAGLNPTEHMNMRGEDSPPIQGRKMLTRWFRLAIEQKRVRPFDPHIMAVAFIGMLKARPFREIILADTELECSDHTYVSQLIDVLWVGIAPEKTS